jgi:hypothetical protein
MSGNADDAVDARQVQAAIAYLKGYLRWDLSADDEEAVRANVERHLKQAATLRAYPLENADGPDFAFRAYRAEG